MSARECHFDEGMRTDRLREQLADAGRLDPGFRAVLDTALICWDPTGGPPGHDYPSRGDGYGTPR